MPIRLYLMVLLLLTTGLMGAVGGGGMSFAQDDPPSCTDSDVTEAAALLAAAQTALETGDIPAANAAAQAAAVILARCEAAQQALAATPESPLADATPLPTLPASNNAELRLQQTDPDLALVIDNMQACYLAYQEIPVGVSLTSYKTDPNFRFYIEGGLLFSINNTALLQTGAVPEPLFREQIINIPAFEVYSFPLIEDLGLFLRGVEPLELAPSGIPFGTADDTGFGLPPGNYRLTAGYINPHDGLTQQADGSYLTPFAAWRGTLVSRDVAFRVVEDLRFCTTDAVVVETTATPEPDLTPSATPSPTLTPTNEPILCRVRNGAFAEVRLYANHDIRSPFVASMMLNQEADVYEVFQYADGERWLRVGFQVQNVRFTGWALRDQLQESAGVPCPERAP